MCKSDKPTDVYRERTPVTSKFFNIYQTGTVQVSSIHFSLFWKRKWALILNLSNNKFKFLSKFVLLPEYVTHRRRFDRPR